MGTLSKSELRLRLKSERQQLSSTQVEDYSQRIIANCLRIINWERVRSLHTYLPIESRNEVNTWTLLEHALGHQALKLLVAVPVMKGQHMQAFRVQQSTAWHKNTLEIPEPVDGMLLQDDQQFDIIIVPMLGFGSSGHRLGSGGGHYDRFLQVQPQALKIGLSYELGRLESGFAHESHDIPLDFVVTEKVIQRTIPTLHT